MNKTLFIILLGVLISCKKKSEIRPYINNVENGYIEKISNSNYEIIVQYQPPEYKADQEIIVNQSKENKDELMKEFDQLQQFLIQYRFQQDNDIEYVDLMMKFKIFTNDTIPCIDAHQVPYSPGAPYKEIVALFPLTEKELGTKFKFYLQHFPIDNTNHEIIFDLKKSS